MFKWELFLVYFTDMFGNEVELQLCLKYSGLFISQSFKEIVCFSLRHLLIVNSSDDNDANPLEAFLRLTDEIVLRMSKAFQDVARRCTKVENPGGRV